MGLYKISFPEPTKSESGLNPMSKSSFRGTASSFMGRRFSTKVQPTLRSFLESPELDDIASTPISTDPISASNSSSEGDDSSSLFTTSTRTSNTLSSDDDASLRELSRRSGGSIADLNILPARHSTACCTDLALRRELRKKQFHDIEPDEVVSSARDCRNSFAMGHSFRRELEMEDRVESLALWEETELTSGSVRDRVVRKGTNNPHSWPHGHAVASLGSGRSKGLEGLFRKPKKSLFNGFFAGLSFSTSRRSRKL